MPITKSAKKALRVASRRRVVNLRRTRSMNEAIKEYRGLTAAGKKAEAAAALSGAYQAIDKAAKRGVIKQNTAARKKSRLSALLAK
jgi:small subunit ribosomal protein S20